MPGNAQNLRYELGLARKHANVSSFWSNSNIDHKDVNNTARFPFITTCLLLGASFREDASDAVVTPLDFRMEWYHSDNEDGVTVLDITDLANLRYCYLSPSGGPMGLFPADSVFDVVWYLEAYGEGDGVDHQGVSRCSG
jgi:hypothetical protein